MKNRHFNTRAAWICFAVLLGFWLLVPMPYWLIGMGLTGTFALLPSLDLLRTGETSLWILSVVSFYGPLIMMGGLLYLIVRERRSRGKEDNAAD